MWKSLNTTNLPPRDRSSEKGGFKLELSKSEKNDVAIRIRPPEKGGSSCTQGQYSQKNGEGEAIGIGRLTTNHTNHTNSSLCLAGHRLLPI
jgi:hypothetical protein